MQRSDVSNQIEQFLAQVCAQVKCQEVHAEIRLELTSHIHDARLAARDAGATEAEAVTQALARMGDPAALGRQLHAAHRPRFEWSVIGSVTLLAVLGLVLMYAAQLTRSADNEVMAHLLLRQGIWTGLGILVAGLLAWVDYRRLRTAAWPLLTAGLVGVVLFQILRAQPARFTPALLWTGIPLLLLVGAAGLFARWDWQRPRTTWQAAGLLLLPTALLAITDNLPGAAIYLIGGLALLRTSGASWRQTLALIGAVGVAGLGFARVMLEPYQVARLTTFLNRDDPSGMGYQVYQSLQTLRAAGPWGHGLHAPLTLLPDPHAELVFPYLVHVLGWVAGGAFCVLMAFFLVRGLRVARRVRDRYGALLVTAAMAMLAVQSTWNILMVLGWAPTTGMSLPFISFGSQAVVQFAAAGLVLGVYRRKDMIPAGAGVAGSIR